MRHVGSGFSSASEDMGSRVRRRMEQVNPGVPSSGLHVAEEATDVVQTGNDGAAQVKTTVSVKGRMQRSVRKGKADRPPAVQVDMSKKLAAK